MVEEEEESFPRQGKISPGVIAIVIIVVITAVILATVLIVSAGFHILLGDEEESTRQIRG